MLKTKLIAMSKIGPVKVGLHLDVSHDRSL
jgi:hypothetical protein